MLQGQSKTHLEGLAQAKLDDALLLSKHKRFSNAYYLGGYTVELGLKACIAERIAVATIPDKKVINAVFTHSRDQLIGIAGLRKELKDKQDSDPDFHTNWGIVTKWSPDSRYDSRDSYSCQIFLEAVANSKHGVFRWIKTYW